MGLAHQEIDLSSLRVGFDFLVPPLPILLCQPAKNLRELFSGKTLDLCLEFIYFRHCVSLPMRSKACATAAAASKCFYYNATHGRNLAVFWAEQRHRALGWSAGI